MEQTSNTMNAFDKALDDFERRHWQEGYDAWLAGHQTWAEHGEFDEERYSLDANPYPDGSREYGEWADGWGCALEDYIGNTKSDRKDP